MKQKYCKTISMICVCGACPGGAGSALCLVFARRYTNQQIINPVDRICLSSHHSRMSIPIHTPHPCSLVQKTSLERRRVYQTPQTNTKPSRSRLERLHDCAGEDQGCRPLMLDVGLLVGGSVTEKKNNQRIRSLTRGRDL